MWPSLREAGEVGGVEAVQQLRDPMLLPLRQHRAAAADGVAVILLKDTLNQIFSAILGSSDPVRIVGSDAVLGIFPHALSLTVAFPPLETASCPVRLLRTKVNCVDEDGGGGGTVHRW